jgi:hypothetical protein
MHLPPAVLEVSHQFLLLCVHRDHRLFAGQKAFNLAIDIFELRVPIRMAAAFLALPVRLETVAQFP